MNSEITLDKYDREGVFVLMIETASQAPIILETEGDQSSFDKTEERIRLAFGGKPLRYCICRLVPVAGNELLPIDMQRMQK